MTDEGTTPRGDDLADPAQHELEPYDESTTDSTSHSPGMEETPPRADVRETGGRAEVPPLRDEKRG
jgi:hypothetical protein